MQYSKMRRAIPLLLALIFVLTTAAFADDNPYQAIMEEYKGYLYENVLPKEDSLINPMISRYAGTDKAILMMVYDLADLNSDGTPELISALCRQDGTYKILDIFTVFSGKVIKLIETDENSQVFLTIDGRLLYTENNKTVLYTLNGNNLISEDRIPEDTESLKIPVFYSHAIQADTIVNMNSWHKYSGTEVVQFGEPFEITATECEDGTADYVIPVTITANKVGMEMSITQFAYLNTKDFPARILVNIDEDQMCIVIRLGDDGQISIEQSLLDTEIGPQKNI